MRVQHRGRGALGTHEHRQAISPRWHVEMERQNRNHRFDDLTRYAHSSIQVTGAEEREARRHEGNTAHTPH